MSSMATSGSLLLCLSVVCLVFGACAQHGGYGGGGGQRKPVRDVDAEPEDNWVWVPPSASNPHQNAPFHIIYPSTDFSYSANGGSRNWPATYSECGGSHQSPINILSHHVPTKSMPRLKFHHYWDNENAAHMNNSGKRVDISLDGRRRMPTLRGGPLPDKYEFVELHFHWGESDALGSEHTVNALSHPMEAHLVHFKKSHGNIKEATKHADGVAVVAFFFQVDKKEIDDFSELVADLHKIKRAATSVKLSSANAAFHWLKHSVNGDYFTYHGSLTTPPCSEVVTWMIYQNAIKISSRQMEEFRKLHAADGKKMKGNYRHPQIYPHPHLIHVL